MLEEHLQFDIITFDDALYSQYYYADHFLNLGCRCIVFVSTAIVSKGGPQLLDISCVEAHRLAKSHGDCSPYMTIDQIKDLHHRGMEIGLHGHTHEWIEDQAPGKTMRGMTEAFTSLREMQRWGIEPKSMAYPYNRPNDGYNILRGYRKDFEFFGDERIPIEQFYKGPTQECQDQSICCPML